MTGVHSGRARDVIVRMQRDLSPVRQRGGRHSHTRFTNPDLVAYAESFGAQGYAIETADQLLPALRHALDDEDVSVIACPVDYAENLRLTDRLGSLLGPF